MHEADSGGRGFRLRRTCTQHIALRSSAAVLTAIFAAYYRAHDKAVVFDTNRVWTGHTSLVTKLYPDAKIICCVRDIGWIIDSVERMLRKNPLQMSRLFGFEPGQSVYARAEILMNFNSGLIGHSWTCLRECWFGDHASRMLLIDYDTLASQPSAVMDRLYEFIGEPRFPHDFDNVQYDETDYDALLGMPGMHRVAPQVRSNNRNIGIPPDLFEKHKDLSFWKRVNSNKRGATVI